MIIVLLIVLCFAYNPLGQEQQTVPAGSRIDCHPAPNATKEKCVQTPGCTWDTNNYPSDLSIPLCYFPPNTGYKLQNYPERNNANLITPTLSDFYGSIFPRLSFSARNYGQAINIRITTTSEKRYEPLVTIPRAAIESTEKLTHSIEKTSNGIFFFKIVRQSTGVALWDTSIGGLLFAPQYIQIATYLPTKKIYGFGEQVHLTLMHNLTKYVTWGMFARDIAPDATDPLHNLYGVHPFYMGLENDNKAHGVLIWNSNAQEVTLGPAPHLIYRTIGGMLDITFFPGPKPEDVIHQYLAFIGKPYLPAYFALGYQLSRWGYTGLDEVEMVVARTQKAGVPLDIVYVDIDYMRRYLDFTVDEEKWDGLRNYTIRLHKDGLHLFLIFDPGIQVTENYQAFVDAMNMKVGFIEWENMDQENRTIQDQYPLVKNTTILLSVVWPDRHVAYPDFFNNVTIEWWIQQFVKFHEKIPLDGIWIDMNEPSAFDTNEPHPLGPYKIWPLWCNLSNPWENVPYKTINVYQYGWNAQLSTKTACMYARTNYRENRFYDTKNLYGLTEMMATNEAHRRAIGKRGAVVSRSTFVSAGRYGNHWLGDNFARWQDMRASLIGVQEFNMFGMPYVGADVCGFIWNTDEELCLRWHQVGAIYPFCRNHNAQGNIPQDPAVWPAVASAARQALLFRYHYLPYLYTLIFEASLNGATVARPVLFEFPDDPNTHDLGHQLMWGSAIMYIPVLDQGVKSVRGYLPPAATWYSIRNLEYGYRFDTGFRLFVSPTTTHIPVFVRGGYIIPRQKPETTTTQSRKNPFELLIAMVYDKNGTPLPSIGQLIWDDGESLVDEDLAQYNYYNWDFEYTADATHATLIIKRPKTANQPIVTPTLDMIDILGYKYQPDSGSFRLNGNPINDVSQDYQSTVRRLLLQKTNFINLTAQETLFTLTWQHSLDNGQNVVPISRRVDCHPSPGATEADCVQRQCIWDSATEHESYPTVPLCYMPPNSGYSITDKLISGSCTRINLTAASYGARNPYGDNISPITFESVVRDAGLGITIDAASRYRPPLNIPRAGVPAGETLYVEISNETPFSFAVKRASSGTSIWDTSIGGLMFADQYIQIATYLPSTDIYGFGESVHLTLKHHFSNYTTQGMFARDSMPNAMKVWQNLYGVHPFYLGIEPDGKAHGVFIINSSPMEITTGPAPHLIYRTIGGMLEIQFFSGPTPEQVIRQYHQFIGLPFLPAYWSLGFQLCRYGYKTLDDLKKVISRNLDKGVPIEVVTTDIDYMDRYKDFTIKQTDGWNQLPEYINNFVHKNNMFYVPITDVGIDVTYDVFYRGQAQNASFIEWESFGQVPEVNKNYSSTKDTKLMLGPVWPDWECAFPDFLDSTQSTSNWWTSEFFRFHEKLAYDGLWIDMNEPSVLATNIITPYFWDDPADPTRPHIPTLKCPLNGPNSHYDMPPYQTWSAYAYHQYEGPDQASLSNKTLCLLGLSDRGKYHLYDTKNLYGLYESIYTQKALHRATGKRGYVLSRSTYPSSGRYAGHWLGDNYSRFASLKVSIIGIQEFNMFGIPYVGADICGFNDNTTEELCLRWQQLGAFYPFMRNHNNIFCIDQDPAVWPSVAAATRQATLFRYHYLPYLYSLHFDVALHGGTVVRPVFFEFVNDTTARNIDHQFLWGSSMMIIPVIDQGQTSVIGYVPTGLWYSLRVNDYGKVVGNGKITFSAPTTELIPVLVRGGAIIPRQRPEMTITAGRKNPFELLIALDNNKANVTAKASGKLYWDDGESIVNDIETYSYYYWKFDFVSTSTEASLYINPRKTMANLKIPSLDIIDVIGYPYCADLSGATISGKPLTVDRNGVTQRPGHLFINSSNLINLSNGLEMDIRWPHGSSCQPPGTTTPSPGTVTTTTPKSAVNVKQNILILAAAFIITSILHQLSL